MIERTTQAWRLWTGTAVAALLLAGPNAASAQQDQDDRNASDSYQSSQNQRDQSNQSQRNDDRNYNDDSNDQQQTRRENRIERRQNRPWRDGDDQQNESQRQEQDERQRQADDRGFDRSDDEPAIGVAVEQDRREGVRVLRVFRDTPADQAGIRVGDQIIEVGGRMIDSPRALISTIQNQRVGQRVDLTLLRDGRERNVSVRLETREEALQRENAALREQLRYGSRQGERMSRSDQYARQPAPQQRWSQNSYDPTPGRSGDDITSHINRLEDEISRLRNEIADLRQMMANRPGQSESDRR